MCGPSSQQENISSDLQLRSVAKLGVREIMKLEMLQRQIELFRPAATGQGVAHELKGIPHPHVVPNGEGLTVERDRHATGWLRSFLLEIAGHANAILVDDLRARAARKPRFLAALLRTSR